MRPPARPSLFMLLLLTGALSACTCNKRVTGGQGDRPPVVVVDPDEIGRPKPTAEVEPNNSRKQAQDLSEERSLEGALSGPADADWYRIQVAAEGEILRATLSGASDLDLVLEAFDEAGKRLVRVNNSQQGGGEVLVNLATRPGTFFLKVGEAKGRSGVGRYRIGYVLREREEGEEVEPNWKAELATPLRIDEDAVGYLGWHTDTDWYQVELTEAPQGSRLRVELDGVDTVRPGLSVRLPDSSVVQERWGRAGDGVILPNLGVPEPRPSHLFVVVRCRYDANVESRYSLRVVTEVPSGPTEVEPNDKPAAATPLAADGRTAMAGLLADTSDLDLFSVKVSRPQVLRVEVVPPLGVDVSLALAGNDGEVVWEVDNGGAREREILPTVWVNPPRGLFRVRAPKRGDVSAVSSYHLRAQPVAGVGWEREPNGTPDTATPLGGEIRGHVHPKRDVDYYRLQASPAQQGTLVVEAPPRIALKVELLHPQGGVAASGVADGRGGAPKAARLALPAGSQLLRVVADPADQSESGKEYVIKVE